MQATQQAPYTIEAESGISYWLCQCGKSKNMPYCDGAHQGSTFQPREVKADKGETLYVCGCGRTRNTPYCDGSHKS